MLDTVLITIKGERLGPTQKLQCPWVSLWFMDPRVGSGEDENPEMPRVQAEPALSSQRLGKGQPNGK